MCKVMPVIPVNRAVVKKIIARKNGVPRWRRDTRVADPPKRYE
jgi:hypothetical protein